MAERKEKYDIVLTAEKVRKRKKRVKIVKLLLLILIILIVALYAVLSFINSGYFFVISLDRNLYYDNGVIIYEDPNYKVFRSKLKIPSLDFYDDTTEAWLPNDLDVGDGSHNGNNNLAYSFYIENTGEDVVDYYDELIIDDVINSADEIIRFRIYFDGEYVNYAKKAATGAPEPGTTPFESDKIVKKEHVEKFKPGDIHRYTIVMWVEGSDPECTNNLLGGELKAHMNFKSVIIEEDKKNVKK